MMPPSAQEVIKAVLSAMADTEDVSWIFYFIALIQISIAACYLFKGFRSHKISTPLIVVSLLMFPLLLAIGFYFATRPVA